MPSSSYFISLLTTCAEIARLVAIMQNPTQFKIPEWFLNRKKDPKDGKFSQSISNIVEQKYRDDLEKLKKIRCDVLLGSRFAWTRRSCMLLCPLHVTAYMRCKHPTYHSGITVVSATCGASVSVVSTPRPPVVVDALLVCPRRSKRVCGYLAACSNMVSVGGEFYAEEEKFVLAHACLSVVVGQCSQVSAFVAGWLLW